MSTQTDVDGNYLLDLEPGIYTVIVGTADGKVLDKTEEVVVDLAGYTTVDFAIKGGIKGSVKHVSGKPLEGLTVEAAKTA